MTPEEKQLITKLDQEVKNLSILMQGTEVGDSLTLKEIRHLLYELNKATKETKPFTIDECINPSSKELPKNLFPPIDLPY